MNNDEHRRALMNTDGYRNPNDRSRVEGKRTYRCHGSSEEAPRFSGKLRVMQWPELRSRTKVDGGGGSCGTVRREEEERRRRRMRDDSMVLFIRKQKNRQARKTRRPNDVYPANWMPRFLERH